VIVAPEKLRSAVTCRASGPGDAPERKLDLLRARDAYSAPLERDGRQWFQVGAITDGPGTAEVRCSGPAGTPLLAEIRVTKY
jgi:hypothetical protein